MPAYTNFIVMPKLETSIKDLIFSNDLRVMVKDVLKIGIEMIRILEGLHSIGICHLDIKPDNIMTSIKKEQFNPSSNSIK